MYDYTEMEALEIDMLVEESYMKAMEGSRCSGRYDDDDDDAAERQYADLVAKLLRMVAPTLLSLAMAFLNVRIEKYITSPRCSFPVLEELTVHRGTIFLTDAAAMADCEPLLLPLTGEGIPDPHSHPHGIHEVCKTLTGVD